MRFPLSAVLLAFVSIFPVGCKSVGDRIESRKHAPGVRIAEVGIPKPHSKILYESSSASTRESDSVVSVAAEPGSFMPVPTVSHGTVPSVEVSSNPFELTSNNAQATVQPASASIEPNARFAERTIYPEATASLNSSQPQDRESPLARSSGRGDGGEGASSLEPGSQESKVLDKKPESSSASNSSIVTPAPEIAGTEPQAGTALIPTMSEPPLPLSNIPSQTTWAIDLATALELTSGQNPQVAYAREKIRESLAKLDGANALWLPSLRAGANYHKHEGRIQDVAGTIIETSRNSVYNGFGAQAVGAGSPAVPGVLMNFHLRDSLFQPRIAGQVVGATRQASHVAANDMLLETALAYCDLLEATQLQVIAAETSNNTAQLAKITSDYASAGAGLPADADRSSAELAVRKMEVQRSVEQVRIRSAKLARLLSHDPQVMLAPAEPFLAPVELVDQRFELASLVAQGLTSRPELCEQQYLVGEAVERLRREQYAPLVPSVLLGLSYGGNGGGLGSSFQNYGDRMDFDAAAFWEVRNLGIGERSARCEAQSRVRQARLRHVQALDRVAAEIVEANAQVQAKREQIPLAESAISSAKDSYRRNQERILNAQGLPIEVLQAVIALDQAQRLYATTIADYNRAQFRLHRALGFAVLDKR